MYKKNSFIYNQGFILEFIKTQNPEESSLRIWLYEKMYILVSNGSFSNWEVIFLGFVGSLIIYIFVWKKQRCKIFL